MPLETKNNSFFLDGKPIQLVSGTIHYFRVVPEYWEDRLLKLKACGLNCVETYVAWNMHEPSKGVFDFDGILDLRKFLEIAKRLNLYVIFRPGPYICAEWDLGGLPSWLLRDPDMKLRSSYQPYIDAVERYMTKLMSIVKDLQYSSGGPIIAVQIENEYGSYGNDAKYKSILTEMFRKVGVTELLFTSDNGSGIQTGHIPEVLITANFQEIDHAHLMFEYLKHVRQPGMPLMAMEFWTGWFDRWSEKHHLVDNAQFEKTLRWLLNRGASVNFYMFHGGTNFGFMNGASGDSSEPGCVDYMPMVTSYDYDAPIGENGDLTEKYFIIQKLLKEFFPEGLTNTSPTDVPAKIECASYGKLVINGYMQLDDFLQNIEPVAASDPLTMEQLPINDGNGQSYGFILYRRDIDDSTKTLKFPGKVADRAVVLLNGKVVDVVDWSKSDHVTQLEVQKGTKNRLDVLVENCGRVNYAEVDSPILNAQRKGLKEIHLNNEAVRDWNMYPLELKKDFINTLWSSSKWAETNGDTDGPRLCRAILVIKDTPKDTFINITGWKKGVIFVNGFNIGRYWEVGPQKTLYIPGPLLKAGANQVMIFELHSAADHVTFDGKPDLGEIVMHKAELPMSFRLSIAALRQRFPHVQPE